MKEPVPQLYADFVEGRYWFDGKSYDNFYEWSAAAGISWPNAELTDLGLRVRGPVTRD